MHSTSIEEACRGSITRSRQASQNISHGHPERKRKLVLLYHQAEHFITEDNLSQKIDEEFERVAKERREIKRTDKKYSDEVNRNRREMHKGRLMDDLAGRRARGKLIVVTPASDEDSRSRGSSDPIEKKAQQRERLVWSTLFGLDESTKPGLEMVDDKAREMWKDKDKKS